jgi:hypothetical protein
MAREFQVTIDAADPIALSRFWAAALHYVIEPPPHRELQPGEDPIAAWREFLEQAGVPEEQRGSASAIVDPDGQGPRVPRRPRGDVPGPVLADPRADRPGRGLGPMIQEWFGYTAPSFPGSDLDRAGARHGHLLLRRVAVPDRGVAGGAGPQPGMMLLIAMAITVAYVASMATSLGLVRPGGLVGARAADRDHAARPLARDARHRPGPRRARGARRAAARRGRAVTDDGDRDRPIDELEVGDVVLVRPGARSPPTARSSRARPTSTSR